MTHVMEMWADNAALAFVRKNYTARGASVLTFVSTLEINTESNMYKLHFDVWKRSSLAPICSRSPFLTGPVWKCVLLQNPGDGFLTSAQEDFSVCFENGGRATSGRERRKVTALAFILCHCQKTQLF